MAEPIQMPFKVWNHVLGGCLDPSGEGTVLEAMRPRASITVAIYYIILSHVRFPVGPLSCNLDQLSLASLWVTKLGVPALAGEMAGMPPVCDPIWHMSTHSSEVRCKLLHTLY